MENKVAALILAGGQGRRMGGAIPKPLCQLGDRPLIAHVLDRVPTTIRPLFISTNVSAGFDAWDYRLLPDRVAGFAGPLAGIDAGLHEIAENHPQIDRMLVLPGDTPFLPLGLFEELAAGDPSVVSVARHRDRLHPAAALWPIRFRTDLSQFLTDAGKHSIQRFLDQIGYRTVHFGDATDAPVGNPFFNINTPDDLIRASTHLANR